MTRATLARTLAAVRACEGASVSELARVLGLSQRDTVARHVARLAELGLVECDVEVVQTASGPRTARVVRAL